MPIDAPNPWSAPAQPTWWHTDVAVRVQGLPADDVQARGWFPRPPMPAPRPVEDAPWTVQPQGEGRARVDLGQRYALLLDERSSQLQILNKANGELTNIWGDPHVDWNKDGRTDVDFWKKTTFMLEDGTKITVDTEPFNGSPDAFVSNNVTVTRGERSLQIKGLSQNTLGDLALTQSDRNGRTVDWAVTDGFKVYENPNGEGWLNGSGRLATQQDFDITRPQAFRPYEAQQAAEQLYQGMAAYFRRLVRDQGPPFGGGSPWGGGFGLRGGAGMGAGSGMGGFSPRGGIDDGPQWFTPWLRQALQVRVNAGPADDLRVRVRIG